MDGTQKGDERERPADTDESTRETRERDPHHALNNPASDPDPTEWPDPYDRRPDPRAPLPEGEAPPHTPAGARSTSAPHPREDPQSGPGEAHKRDKLDR